MTAPHDHLPDKGLPDAGLPDAPARRRITDARDETLFVEAGAGSGKTRSLVDRVVALVGDGVEMRHIAAITFTEKAAAELRDRIRKALTTAADEAADEATHQRFATSLEQVDAAAISTLHAFAQRVLTENPIEAGLPPNVEVLDEVASQVEFTDRWTRFRDRLFEDPDLERCLLLAFTAGVRPDDLRSLAKVFGANWDLASDPRRVPWADTEPQALDLGPLLRRLDDLVARRDECRDGGDKLCLRLTEEIAPYAERLRAAPDEYEALRLLCHDAPKFTTAGRKDNWDDKNSVVDELRSVGEYLNSLTTSITDACVHRLAAEIARFTREAADARRADGRLEFHDLLVMARALLRGEHGLGVRRRLRQRYQRLLLDEFQDTDPIQIELACLLASDDPDAGGKPWQQIPVEPGRLFFVGDPKQSIYRFRRADIGLFLSAREAFGTTVSLTTNFRATPPLIDWVNHVFGQLISYEEGSQPEYQPIDAAPTRTVPPAGPPVTVLGTGTHPGELKADDLREREAADVADAVLTACGWQVSEEDEDGGEYWRGARLGDITILLPARTSLAALERALDARAIPYRAETSSLVYATREIRDLMATARAVADPTDQLALMAALRSPVFGCGDDDLFTYKVVHGGRWSLFAEPPETLDASHPVVAALRELRSLHDEVSWLAPSELLARIAHDRRLFELGYAFGRPRDLWRRLRFVIDQARAWSEAEGGTVREYLEWARWQASESTRVAETVLPETDDDSVRIMTIHSAKGLEFPITILSGMTTAGHGANSRVEVTFPNDEPAAIKVGRSLATREFEAHEPIDEQMDHHERLRLLYVAATRAQDHLVVSLHRKARKGTPAEQNYTNAELLAGACADLDLVELEPTDAPAPEAAAVTPPEPLPDLDEWEAERADKLRTSSRRRSLGASDVALLTLSPEPDGEPAASDQEARPGQESTVDEEETAAGAAKQPRDLELPPWQKGRYGTAIGRAVHGVLQTVDLATGAELPETVAAQAAAEGVIGREADIRRLAQAALDAPVVKESLRWPRWRETYVATQVGDRTLEGYLDLLYRTDDGLVIVDYKTASTTAHLEARMDTYRAQGGAYAVAVERAVGEPVVRVVFCFLTAGGAVELALPDLEDAKHDVRAAVTAGL